MRFLFLRAGLLMFALGFTGLMDPCQWAWVVGVWRERGRSGGGTVVFIQLGLRGYKSCSDDLYLTAPAKKNTPPGVLHWRKLGTYRLWGVQLFTTFHLHNITSSNKLVMSLFIKNRVKGILKINSIIIKRTPSTEKRPSFSDHFASTRAHYFSIDGKLQSCIRVKYMFFVVVVVVFLCFFFLLLFPPFPCDDQIQKGLASAKMRGRLCRCYVKLHYGIALGVGYGPSFLRTFNIVTATERRDSVPKSHSAIRYNTDPVSSKTSKWLIVTT